MSRVSLSFEPCPLNILKGFGLMRTCRSCSVLTNARYLLRPGGTHTCAFLQLRSARLRSKMRLACFKDSCCDQFYCLREVWGHGSVVRLGETLGEETLLGTVCPAERRDCFDPYGEPISWFGNRKP